MGKSAFSALKAKHARFHLRDVAVALIKLADIHEGLWQIQVLFGNSAANLEINGALQPTALTSVAGLQLTRVEHEDALTVDAAKANPPKRLIVPAGLAVN